MSKTKHHHFIDTIDEVITNGVNKEVFHLYTEDQFLGGRTIKIHGKDLINFGSCSYLGLELDHRLKLGTIEAVLKYGTQVSASRTYLSCGLYSELEEKLSRLFEAHVVIAPTTSLAHLASIPILIEDNDAVILDQQVHASVQTAVQVARTRGVRVEMIRHSRLDMLEDMIKDLRAQHDKIWYMVDGIYSMHGDFAPLPELLALMNKYEQFHLYVDDAHGMSWTGKNGRGYTLDKIGMHDKMVVATSLAKAFGTGGGILMFPTAEMARKVKTCGGTLIYSGPIQPPMLGASVASANIHLSDEINILQQQLKEKMEYTNMLMKEYELPTTSCSNSPVNFICIGMPSVGYNIGRRLMNDGFYVNLALFPAVPVKNSGIRFTSTLHQTKDDIKNLLQAIQHHLPLALKQEGLSPNDVRSVFNLPLVQEEVKEVVNEATSDYKVQCETSIANIDKTEWDRLMSKDVACNWEQLRMLEQTFRNNEKEAHNWNFYYYIIRDKNNVPKLATFFTCMLCKDDIFSPPAISMKIEKQRLNNPQYLTSRTFMMGSLLSVGNHMYIDRADSNWTAALALLLRRVAVDQEKEKSTVLCMRDFDKTDTGLQSFFLDKGLVRVSVPDTHIVSMSGAPWSSVEEYSKTLKQEYRYYLNKKFFPFRHYYDVKITDHLSDQEAIDCYNLFKNVSDKQFEINVFDIPENFFHHIKDNPQLEVMLLSIKHEFEKELNGRPVGFALCYKSKDTYCFMITGMDYNYLTTYQIYPQLLGQIIARAKELNLSFVNMGLTASQNKRKFGAKVEPQVIYFQANDNFNMELISMMPSL